MSKNQLNMPQYRAKLPRSGFDMSQSLAFTASTGMILPVYSDFLNAGESIHYSSNLFARTQPMVTPAMADVDIYIDWFFVPMTMLFTAWGQVRYQTNDFISSLYFNPLLNTDKNDFSLGFYPVMDLQNSFWKNPTVSDELNSQQPFFAKFKTSDGQQSQVFTYPDIFECAGKSLYRMYDMLGFNPNGTFVNLTKASGDQSDYNSAYFKNPNVFPWRALAYQAIYQNHFRNDDYEQLDVSCYNWDYACGMSSGDIEDSVKFGTMSGGVILNPRNPFILRYADFRRDYFQTVKPSPLVSGINFLSPDSAYTLQKVNNYLSSIPVEGVQSSGVYVPSGIGDGVGSGTVTQMSQNLYQQSNAGGSSTVKISSGSLRSLFAVEKLIRVSGRAMKTYDAQVLAHFGYRIPHDVKHELTHLRSSHALLHVGEVVGTADTFDGTNGSALGELAGKGYVSLSGEKSYKFEAPVDGVVMAVFRAIPRLRVQSSFDKQNAVANRIDFFIPEFDKLGMQPMYQYEYNYAQIGTNSQFGWQYRYSQWKQKYDRVTSVFSSFSPRTNAINQYSSWVLAYSPFSLNARVNGGTSSTYTGTLSGQVFKCPPTMLNSIMAIPYQPKVSATFAQNPALEFQTDPFICDFRANVKKVSTMSPTGEPDMVSL